jgi:putative spermidine/putrescine transport system substrate-binding protein
MKKVIVLLMTVLLAATMAASAASAPKALLDMNWEEIKAAAKEEGKVVFWVWHDESFWVQLGQAFEKKYGIKFELVFSEKTAGDSKILAEKDSAKGSFDVFKVGGETTKLIMDANLLAGPILSKIEVKDKLDQGLSARQEGVETKGYLVPAHRNQTGLLYNPRTVSNPPQTWAELEAWIDANPKKFGFCSPDKGGSGQAFVLSVIKEVAGGLDKYYGDTEVVDSKVANWDLVWKWINDRKSKITITTSNNDSLARLNQGELNLVAAWDDNTFNTIKAGELFKDATLYIPKFGMAGGGDTLGLMKNAPHPAAGLLLINYMVSDEGQQLFMTVMNTYPARTDLIATSTLLKPEDMQYRLEEIPAAYKSKYIEDFVKNVLMVN